VWQSSSVNNTSDPVKNWITVEQAAEALNVPKGRVNRLLEEYSLVAVKKEGQLMIPADVIVQGEPLAPLRGTIIMLLDSGYSIEESIDWLFTHSDVLGQTPLQSLLEGKKAPVRRLAQMLDI
jgi:excisionase family DNA binding protein